ncbi:glutaminyl-peptide cyclotransferase [Parafilimonas sp.]|uniref:glutaminyl-peptide cyclotransferase n=1 Tax=Parafilimonas sp. TaxID=1969739 RepID=UPI0039E52F24
MKFLNKKSLLVPCSFFSFLLSCKNNNSTAESSAISSAQAVPQISYSVIKAFPHDTSLFTEGLVFYDGKIYESTGSPADIPFTKSLVIANDLSTGGLEKKIELDKKKYFGEGIVFPNTFPASHLQFRSSRH